MDFLACLNGASDSATGGRWLVRMEDTADAWRACEEGSLGLGAEMGVVRFEGGMLELVLRRPMKAATRHPVVLRECHAGGGTLPGIDLNDSASLLDRMDERD